MYGPEVFSIRGATSDEHDEAFFLWLIREHDHLRSHVFSTDFAGSYTLRFDNEPHDEIGVDLSFIDTDSFIDVGSVTRECIGLRLSREGRLKAVEAGDSYAFVLPSVPPLKVWAVLVSSQGNALKALGAYEPAAVHPVGRYIVFGTGRDLRFDSPTGRLE